MAMISGIDLSHHNGPVDFAQLASSGVVFAYIKATEGRFTQDRFYEANYAGLKDKGIFRGAYHFFYPNFDPQEQAENFLSVVTQLGPGDLPPVVDIEVSGEESPTAIATALQLWLDAVEEDLDRQPIIYTGPGFWNGSLGGTSAFSEYSLWVAHYTSNPSPTIPKGFTDYLFWQYSESGSVSGVKGNVDLDWFNGSSSDLAQLAGT